jgi:hypothetical protein
MPMTSKRMKFAATIVLLLSAVLPAAAKAPTPGTSTVVYVSGDDLVLKGADGKLLNFTIPTGYHFSAAGKELALEQLKPGMVLTKPVTIASGPKVIASVTTVKGTVYSVTPPNEVTLSLPDGAKDFVVPAGTKFMVAGKPVAVADLKHDMPVEATVIATVEDGTAPSATAEPATPPMVGPLLIAKAGETEENLPMAGTALPAFGIVGLGLLAVGALMLMLRKPRARVS